YSMGVVLYEMLTGQVPFTGESPVEIAMKHLSDTPRPPSLLRPDIPPDLDMVVLRALAKRPEDRFQTAEEMDAELGRVAAGAGVTAETADAATAVLSRAAALDRAPTAHGPAPPPRRRRPGARRTATRSLHAAGARSGPGCSPCSSSSRQACRGTTPSARSRTPWAARGRSRCRSSSRCARTSRSRSCTEKGLPAARE